MKNITLREYTGTEWEVLNPKTIVENVMDSSSNKNVKQLIQDEIRQVKSPYVKDFRLTGHRGMIENAPENTLTAFQYCYEFGVVGFECDVYQLNTGEFVIIHDDTLDRTTTGTGDVRSKTLEQIKSYDAGSKFNEDFTGETIPTLEEMLTFSKNKFEIIYLEVKAIDSISQLYNIVKDANMLDVTSFHGFLNAFEYDALRALDEKVKISLITEGSDYDAVLAKAIELNAFEIAIDWNWLKLNPTKVKEVQDNGIRVYVWNANLHNDLRDAVNLGVNGVNANNPLINIKGGRLDCKI